MQSRKKCALNVIMIVFAVFIILNYSIYLSLTLINGGKLWNALVAVSILAVTVTPLLLLAFFGRSFEKKHKKLLEALKIIYTCGMGVYVISFTAFSLWVTAGVNYTADTAYDYVIVFGGGVKNGHLSRYGEKRLNTAIEYLNGCENATVILSGGVGENEIYSEAEVMRAYLVKNGISGDRIILEDRATNTWENIEFSFDLMEDGQTVLGISSDYHVKRIELMGKDQNVEFDMIASKSEFELNTISSYVREYMAYFKYFLGLNDI